MEWGFNTKKNFNSSKIIFDYAKKNKLRLIYASSASVYGSNNNFKEDRKNENLLIYMHYQNYFLITT